MMLLGYFNFECSGIHRRKTNLPHLGLLIAFRAAAMVLSNASCVRALGEYELLYAGPFIPRGVLSRRAGLAHSLVATFFKSVAQSPKGIVDGDNRAVYSAGKMGLDRFESDVRFALYNAV